MARVDSLFSQLNQEKWSERILVRKVKASPLSSTSIAKTNTKAMPRVKQADACT
jgi:hypothetical protein